MKKTLGIVITVVMLASVMVVPAVLANGGGNPVITVEAEVCSCRPTVGCEVTPTSIVFGGVDAGECNSPDGAPVDIQVLNTSTNLPFPEDCECQDILIDVSAAVTGSTLAVGLKYGGCASPTGTVDGWSVMGLVETATMGNIVYDVPADAEGDIGGSVTITFIQSE